MFIYLSFHKRLFWRLLILDFISHRILVKHFDSQLVWVEVNYYFALFYIVRYTLLTKNHESLKRCTFAFLPEVFMCCSTFIKLEGFYCYDFQCVVHEAFALKSNGVYIGSKPKPATAFSFILSFRWYSKMNKGLYFIL
jgi:hypothetical protein